MFKRTTNYRIIYFLFLAFLLGCIGKVGYVKKGEDIEPEDRKAVKYLSAKVFDNLKRSDTQSLHALISPEIPDITKRTLDSFFTYVLFSDSQKIVGSIGEYYIYNFNSNLNQVSSTGLGYYDYRVQFPIYDKETFLYLVEINSTKQGNTALLTMLFNKLGDDWKLSGLWIRPFSYKNRKGPDFYLDAKQELESGRLISTVLRMQTAMKLSLSEMDNFHYNMESEMQGFFENVVSKVEGRYRLPVLIKGQKTNIEVTGVQSILIHKDIFPEVAYKSFAATADEIASENLKFDAKINEYFPGIKETADSIVYTVTSIFPDLNTSFVRPNSIIRAYSQSN